MYEYLKGTLIENNASYVVIDVQGIGYKVWVPPGTITFRAQENCILFTSFVVRENAQLLYGFSDSSTRNLFEILIQISGVGPKTALCILSQFSASHFKDAVMSENTTLISSVPGLGKKTAEKLILELKDKLFKLPLLHSSGNSKNSSHYADAIQALVHLGFSEKAAKRAVEKVTKDTERKMELSEIITEALRVH